MLSMIEVEIDRDGRVHPLEPLPYPLQGRADLALLPDPSTPIHRDLEGKDPVG
ncbi:hypothetical protein [uncultured Thiodictyon sp.]|jgi:hypothetical protein|uniref:hypothetical protein n=1 Tax=uncultured Thiodictyon sp. TaxID=1846217 RepID=UPI0025FBD990|nr:hypothetical protein [uncultured Thiodictyon sp.]